MSTKEHINRIIDRTFTVIQDVYNKQKEVGGVPNIKPLSRILFPQKRKEPVRVSEQELRFIFVEQLNIEIQQGWDVYYSIETPTLGKYDFRNNGAIISEDGQSASFDLVIHDKNYQRIALIEFKAKNAGSHEHLKDFVKLTNPDEGSNICCYFIEIIEGYDKGTIRSLKKKVQSFDNVEFRCWSLNKSEDITEEILN